VRYKTNDYSVPVAYGYRDVWIRGYVDQGVIGCGGDVIARQSSSTYRVMLSVLWTPTSQRVLRFCVL
jgi:hypothetical protein